MKLVCDSGFGCVGGCLSRLQSRGRPNSGFLRPPVVQPCKLKSHRLAEYDRDEITPRSKTFWGDKAAGQASTIDTAPGMRGIT